MKPRQKTTTKMASAAYANIEPSIYKEKQKEIERHMLHLVYQYTRPNDIEDSLNQTIDYTGAKGLQKGFFDKGVMNA